MKFMLFPPIMALLLLVGCGRHVLPSERAMMKLSESEVRSMVLSNTPVGMHRSDVEKVFRRSFHRTWKVIDYKKPAGFVVPVSNAEYYFRSDFATVRSGWFANDVITVSLLFGPNDQVKDVKAEKWTDSL